MSFFRMGEKPNVTLKSRVETKELGDIPRSRIELVGVLPFPPIFHGMKWLPQDLFPLPMRSFCTFHDYEG